MSTPGDPRSVEGTWEKLSQVAVQGAEYDSRERQPHPECLQGTRVDLLDYIYELLDNEEKSRLIWLNGTAGVGKSAVAFTVADRMRGLKVTEERPLEKRLAGTFFFSRKYTKRCTTGYFFTTLVYQLASNFPSIRDDLSRDIRENPALLDPDKSLRHQMETLFLQPLQRLRFRLSGLPPVVFVVDALDECTSEAETATLISLLGQVLRDPLLPVIHILLTSRSEAHIREAIHKEEMRPLACEIPVRTSGDSVVPLLSLEGADVDHDIYFFLKHSFTNLLNRYSSFPQPTENDLARLANRAGRRFIVASTMMKFIDDGHNDPRSRLQLMLQLTSNLLPGTEVYKLYDLMLSTCADPKRAYQHLSVVAALANPLPISQISELLGPGEGKDVKTALEQLRSVMDIPTNSSLPVNIYHSSVRDYVLNPSNCGLFGEQGLTPPHTLLAYSSICLMIHDIPESTGLLDALLKLKTQSQVMQSHDPQSLKDLLAFIVEPPDPLQILTCLLWLRGDRDPKLQSWLETPDGQVWLCTQGGKDWLETRGGLCWLQTYAGLVWLQSPSGRDWLWSPSRRDLLQSPSWRDWLQSLRGRDWLQSPSGRDWMQSPSGRNWMQSSSGRDWTQSSSGRDWLRSLRGGNWLQSLSGRDWLQSLSGRGWLQSLNGRDWLQSPSGKDWMKSSGGRDWLQLSSGRDWLQSLSGRDWLQSPSGEDWVKSSSGRNWLLLMNSRDLLQSPDWRDWLQSSSGWGWLESSSGRDWLRSPSGKGWLESPSGRNWLESPSGKDWMRSSSGRDWLESSSGRKWLESLSGRGWLESPSGEDWVESPSGRDWLQSSSGRDWLLLMNNRNLLQSPDGRDWLQSSGEWDWLESSTGRDWQQSLSRWGWLRSQIGKGWLESLSGGNWLESPSGEDWVKSSSGRDWLQSSSGRNRLLLMNRRDLQSQSWRNWRQSPTWRDWLHSPNGRDWLESSSGWDWLESSSGWDWLESSSGWDWLRSPSEKGWLWSPSGWDWLQSLSGGDWLQSLGGRDWLHSLSGRDWLQSPNGRDWLQSPSGRNWLQSPGGKDWLQLLGEEDRKWILGSSLFIFEASNADKAWPDIEQVPGGHLESWLPSPDKQYQWRQTPGGQCWLQTPGGRSWLRTLGGREWLLHKGGNWLQSSCGQEWLQTSDGREWLQTQGGREWLQTPHGQAWQSTPAGSFLVHMEEFLITVETINEFVIVPELSSLLAFQLIQQFKSLPDLLMFPAFLTLTPKHPTSALLARGPDMEIIHAFNAFVSFTNEARERSRSASNALTYACQNWAMHLSRAPKPLDNMLDHIFKVFWDHHLLSWLEMQWCLRGLRSCLVVLSEGQKLAKEHHNLNLSTLC